MDVLGEKHSLASMSGFFEVLPMLPITKCNLVIVTLTTGDLNPLSVVGPVPDARSRRIVMTSSVGRHYYFSHCPVEETEAQR